MSEVRVIAEAGTANHDIDYAAEAAHAAKEAGCWAIKYQLLNPDTLTAPDAPRYDRLPGPANQYELFRGALPYDAWGPVFNEARRVGIEVFASCWDIPAVEWCAEWGVNWFKVGSADITYRDMLHTVAAAGTDVLFSTGAATSDEIVEAESMLMNGRNLIVPMACTLSYPADEAHLGRIRFLRETLNYDVVGYSDHTRGAATGAMAVAAGATYLEKHFTLIGAGGGGDHDFALTPRLMRSYVQMAEEAAEMIGDTLMEPADSELDARYRARRSLHAVMHISQGEPLLVGVNVAWLRPAEGGIKANQVVPSAAFRDYGPGEQIEPV